MSELIVKKLTKIYGKRKILDSISLHVSAGSVVGLLGPNGAGKSTTFYIIVGLIKPDNGNVYLNGINITNYPTHIRATNGIGYLPQDCSIFKKLTVEENLMMILEFLPLTTFERKNKANKLMKELGILKLANKYANVLSGGERRRLEIARSLICDPKIILLDEPFAGIDPIATADVINIIKYLKNKNMGVLISDHNVRETLGVCDIAFILNNGKVVESGTPVNIIKSNLAREVYLGNKFKL